VCHLSIEFCEDRLSSFCVILLTTNKQTNKQTNAYENITSLAEVISIRNPGAGWCMAVWGAADDDAGKHVEKRSLTRAAKA